MLVTGVVAFAIALVPAQTAVGASGDASATQAYLSANYALLRVGQRNLKASEAAYKSIRTQVTRECPAAASNSPQDSQSTQLSNEVIGAMVVAAAKPDLPAIKAYLRTVSVLHWGNASVEHAVSGYTRMLRTLSKLAAPHLCADVRSWVSSGFTKVPAVTVSFDRAFIPNWVSLGVQPQGLGSLESASGKALARRSSAIEAQITEVEAHAVRTWGDIMDELVLSP